MELGRIVTESDIQQIIDSLTEDRWSELPIDAIRTDMLAYLIVKNYVRYILLYDKKQTPFIYLNGEQRIAANVTIPQVGEVPFYKNFKA